MSLIACQVQLLGEAGKVPGRVLLLNDGDLDWAGQPDLVLDEKSAQLIIKDFEQQGVDLVIDYHHSTVAIEDRQVEKALAAGWIKGLEYVPGEGLYARIEWTTDAEQEIQKQQYRYISPVIQKNKKTDRIERLHSVALTNRPRTRNQQALLDAAEDKEIANMGDPKKCADLKGVRGLVCQALAAGEDNAAQEPEPEMTQDAEAIGKLLAALRDQGVDIADDASLAEIIEAAIEALGAGAAEEQEAEAGENKSEAEAKPEAKESTEVTAELNELRIKAANVEKLNTRVAKLEADKTRDHVASLIDEQIEANKLLPDDKKTLAAARWLAENDETRFKTLFASMQPIAEPGVLTKGGTTRPKGERQKLVAAALVEYDENPNLVKGRKQDYVAVALQENNMVPLTDDEVKALVA